MVVQFGSCVEILPTAQTGSDPADNYWRTLEGIIPEEFAVELWPTNVNWRPYSPRHLALLRRACEGAPRISVHGVVPRWDLDGLRRELDVCNAVGATLLVLHSSALGLAGPIRADAAVIRSFIREARRRGISIALENCPESPDAFAAMVREANGAGEDANLAVCLDVGHTVFMTGNLRGPAEYLRRLPEGCLQHLHLHDIRDGRDHRIPGEGDLDWRHLIRALHTARYSGVYLIELNHPPQPLEMIRQSHRFLKSILEEIEREQESPASLTSFSEKH